MPSSSHHVRQVVQSFAAGLALLVMSGCAGPTRGPAVPADIQDRAVIPGMTTAIRTWGSGLNPEFQRELMESIRREQEHLRSTGHSGPLPRADFLAISGGGADGAFTAGLMNGWTAAGNRPVFKAVTGISTGALIAPFAYLGSDYDATLKKFYTQVRTHDILRERGALAALGDDALADTTPLRGLIKDLIDPKLVEAIAREYQRGRLLMIGTANLDAQRGVIWNIGAIAASNHPRKAELIRDILIASAAIPAAFPPVMFDVEADGKRYQELHADGGTVTQVFLYPPSMKLREQAEAAGATRERRAFIIRNSRFEPTWQETKRRTLPIAGRAVSTLIATQGIGDMYRTYLNAQRDGIDFNLAFIPADFTEQPSEAFDPKYMQKLYDVGYELGRKGYPWMKTPPRFQVEEPH